MLCRVQTEIHWHHVICSSSAFIDSKKHLLTEFPDDIRI